MVGYPCLNPRCRSYGKSHPSCNCYGGAGQENFAGGGRVTSGCPTNGEHQPTCEYFADGGMAGLDIQPAQPESAGDTTPLDIQPNSDPDAALQAKYGSPAQQAMAGIEGAGEGLAGPLYTGFERAIGIPGEDIAGREAANPMTHNITKAATMVGSAITGTGEMGLLAQIGGGAATKIGVGNALYTLGDEFSKMLKNDPSTVQAAALHVGLSGILGVVGGAALGKVSDAWLGKIGPKADEFVNDFIGSMQGLPRELETPGAKAGAKFINYLSKSASEALASGAGAAAGHATGIPGAGYLGALLGHKVIRPMVDKFLPTIADTVLNSGPSIAGLKAAFDTMDSVLTGVHALDKGADALFKMSSTGALDHLLPDKTKLDKLDEHLSELDQNPEQMMEISGQLGHYMPVHSAALAMTAQNAVNYLSAQKPRSVQLAPLDQPIEPTATKQTAYRKTLELAESPLAILQRVYNGRLQPKDLQDLQALYPSLMPPLRQTIGSAMIAHMAKGEIVPYHMRSSISLLLGQPMDSTFSPMAMLAAQSTYAPKPPPNPAQAPKKVKKGTAKMGEAAENAQTPAEDRQEALSKP